MNKRPQQSSLSRDSALRQLPEGGSCGKAFPITASETWPGPAPLWDPLNESSDDGRKRARFLLTAGYRCLEVTCSTINKNSETGIGVQPEVQKSKAAAAFIMCLLFTICATVTSSRKSVDASGLGRRLLRRRKVICYLWLGTWLGVPRSLAWELK